MVRKKYYSDKEWEKVKKFADTMETPFLVVNTNIIKRKFNELKKHFPFVKIYYAVKANPAKDVIKLLYSLGSNFDIASIYELDKVMELGVPADRLSYGNTIKKSKHIAYAYERGVRLFVSDSETDLNKIAEHAPGSKVFIRILTESSSTADWPLSRKFGCHSDMAIDLVVMAKKLGLEPYGISFHVGSQQRDIGSWDDAIAKGSYIFNWLKEEEGIKLQMMNLGGGFPASYVKKTNTLATYSKEITRYLQEDFGDDMPEIILEPGRSLVADAGILVSEIVNITKKNYSALYRWVYTDVGKFGGLIETIDESIKFPIYYEIENEKELTADDYGEVVIAGPTCDSMDTMYEDYKYTLPLNLKIGKRLYWFSTGAYTSSYSSVEFNGFPPLKTYII